MNSAVVYFWKRNPFIRIFPAFALGIMVQWYTQWALVNWWVLLSLSFILFCLFIGFSFFRRYRFAWLRGIALMLFFTAIGAVLTCYNDIRNDPHWFVNSYSKETAVLISIDEPLVEKARSFKANATLHYIIKGDETIESNGKIIIYFKKDSSLLSSIDYGSQVIFRRSLQEIRNSGNPGAFDYKRYCLFQGITHQVYLTPDEFIVLNNKKRNFYQRVFYPVRQKVLDILRANIKGERELGLAEALLVGYKNDLDKSLVQSYSNTGVVHVIAISGLHIGLIYWLLLSLLRPLRNLKYIKYLQPLLIIAGLWGFSLLAGGQPSVLRSAVMFTCIVVGQSAGRSASIFNTLAFSAFILLCYNPYWLWDAGFQLSYSAVLSIIIFMKPVYNWFYIKNKILDMLWKLNAVTIAAQILTLPVSIYHFHQFPNAFLLTNIVAVPLSSIIVLGEILLCAISFIPSISVFIGNIISWLIRQMNNYIELIERLPNSVWDGLQIDIAQAVLLVLFITLAGLWLMEKWKPGLFAALISLLAIVALRSQALISSNQQQKIIVYNIPGRRGIDFISGENYFFYGDSILMSDEYLQNFHIKPSRILNRVSQTEAIDGLFIRDGYAGFCGRKVVLLDSTRTFRDPDESHPVDLLLIAGAPRINIPEIAKALYIKQVVFDGSVPFWKLARWKKDCDSLHIPFHDVSEKGAFVMKLN